jgi:hypothetical protein
MNNQNICDDGALLLGYTAGSLDHEESARVAGHVERCPRCREMVRENESLIQVCRAAKELTSRHPSSEILTLLAEGPADTPDMIEARAHVENCGECLEVVSVLEKVGADLSRQEEPKRPGESMKEALAQGPTFWRRAVLWFSSPVPAYILVLLMVYPAYLGLVGIGRLNSRLTVLESPTLLAPPVALETGRERGREEPRLTIDEDEGRRVITFFIPIAAERYLYRAELTRRGGRVFYDEDAQSFDGIGTFALYLPEGALAPGDYELRVEEIERQSREVANVIEFAFTLTR